MRDTDANTDWDAASDATLEERRYYCQNWRADVVALMKSRGDVTEWITCSIGSGMPSGIIDLEVSMEFEHGRGAYVDSEHVAVRT